MSETKFQVLTIFLNFYIQPPVSVFLFLMLHSMLDGLILFQTFFGPMVNHDSPFINSPSLHCSGDFSTHKVMERLNQQSNQ